MCVLARHPSMEKMSFLMAQQAAGTRQRLPVSLHTLFSLRMAGEILSVRLGGRRILFHWPSVVAALLRHQRGGWS